MAKKTRSGQRRRPQQRARPHGGRPAAAPQRIAPAASIDIPSGGIELTEDSPAAIEDAVQAAEDGEAPAAEAAPRAGVARPLSAAGSATAGPATAATARRVGRIDPASARRLKPGRSGAAAIAFDPLEVTDPSIPFDRVPYVPADLRRVGVMATVMVALIVAAAIIVTLTVK